MKAELLEVSPEVRAALEANYPVVALETTLVAHGFPRPTGSPSGSRATPPCAAAGALPATVGVLDGRIKVGLTEDELARFTPTPARPARATSPPAP